MLGHNSQSHVRIPPGEPLMGKRDSILGEKVMEARESDSSLGRKPCSWIEYLMKEELKGNRFNRERPAPSTLR